MKDIIETSNLDIIALQEISDLNEFNEAIKLYEKALSISNEKPIVYYSLALAHQGIGNFEKSNFKSL